ncbi:MAG: apolipoprotein N-acyltransferase [Candidatus Binatia bacterium]|nr:MAG: apolipoprotein N-acyltransferase [Candidatus Binatia bacterium]
MRPKEARTRISRAWHLAAIAGGAALLSLYARAEWPYAWLGWIALVPWLLVWSQARSVREVVLLCALCAALFLVFSFYWFAEAIAAYTGWSRQVAFAVLAGTGLILQPQLLVLALWAYGVARFPARSGWVWILEAVIAAGAYVSCECLVPTKLLADTLGFGLWPLAELAQAADLGGVFFLTFCLIAVNFWIAGGLLRVLRQRNVRTAVLPVLLSLALVGTLSLYGAWRLQQINRRADQLDGRSVRVGIVQGNLSHYDDLRARYGTFEAVRTILDRYLNLTQTLVPQADLWIWPETVYPTTFARPKSHEGALFDREIAAFVQVNGRPLIFGAYDSDGLSEYNAAFFLLPDSASGLTVKTQRKLYPFPFTESVPSWLDNNSVRSWFPWLGTWKRGTDVEVVALPVDRGGSVRLSALICYDAVLASPAHTAVRRGAELLVSLSNDSWFAHLQGRRLALIASAMRSIETRRPQVRVTPTGLSAVMDIAGRVRLLLPPDEPTATVAEVDLGAHEPTLAVRTSGWIPWACLVGAGIGLMLRFAQRWSLPRSITELGTGRVNRRWWLWRTANPDKSGSR